jgi:hypothetical protein
MRQSQDHHGAADRDIEVYIYTPLNEGITSATHRRLEGYLRKLQPEEIGRFVRLVKSVRAELAGEDKKEDDIEHHDREEGPKIERLEGMLFERDSQLAKLRKQVDQRDTKSEDDEAKASEWRSLRDKLEEKTKRLRDQKALTEGLNDELKIWRDLDAKRASVSRGNAGNADDIAAGTGEGDADGADDDAPTFDHADDFESSVNGTGLSKKPETRHASTKKPLPNKPSFTPTPRTTRLNSQTTTDQPATSKKPQRTGQTKGGTSAFLNGYEEDDGEAWSINDDDPEKIRRDLQKKSREANAKGSLDPETPANAATGTSAAGDSTGTLAGQTPTEGPGRKQSKVTPRAAKPATKKVEETEDESDQGIEVSRKPVSEKKRKAETLDREEQPATSKKPKRATKLQPVKENSESHNEDKQLHADKGRRASSGPKAKLSRAQQDVKRKVARDDSAESEGGMSDPICISSGEDTDSDADDEY